MADFNLGRRRKKVTTSVSAAALITSFLALGIQAARAADVTVSSSSTETNTVNLSDGDILTNDGTISVTTGYSNGVRATTSSGGPVTIYNFGTISGGYPQGYGINGDADNLTIYNGSSTNRTAVIEAAWYGVGVNSGVGVTLYNYAIIRALYSGGDFGVANWGASDVAFINYSGGQISGPANGDASDAAIGNGWQTGTRNTPLSGYVIDTITNEGTLSGTVYDIANGGTITTLNNAQGAGGSAVKYTGFLPTNYNVIIRSTSSYGQLVYTLDSGWASAPGQMTFGIYAGGVTGVAASTLTGATYSSVLQGIERTYLTGVVNDRVTGTTLGYSWSLELVDSVNWIWDLVVTSNGPDADYTLDAVKAVAERVVGVLNRRLTGLANASGHDCRTFDRLGYCVSFQARYTASDGMNEGGGLLTAAYRLTDEIRVGGFIDHRVGEREPTGISFSDERPMFGGFVGYSSNRDGTGLQGKVIGAFQNGDATITRSGSTSLNTESGSGKAGLSAYLVSGELGYGFALSGGMLATPYVGLRHADASRGAYDESTVSGSVDYPLSFKAHHQRLTTAVTGMRLGGMLTERIGYQLGAGVEYDVRRDANDQSGTSSISGLETFSVSTGGSGSRTRGFGSVGLHYQVEKNQRLTGNVGIRSQAYSAEPSLSAMAGYQISF